MKTESRKMQFYLAVMSNIPDISKDVRSQSNQQQIAAHSLQ